MNYFASSATRPLPAQQVPQTPPAHSSLPTPLLLRAISMALTNSLNNYHNVVVSSNSPLEPAKQADNGSGEGLGPQNTVQNGPEGLSLTRLPARAQNKNVPKQHCAPPRRDRPSRAKNNHHLSTSEELLEDRPQKALTSREERTRKKSAADGARTDLQTRPLPEPVVDLIETAYLPECGLDRAEVCRIREKLGCRLVAEWNEKIKLRAEKRQLRLLGC